MTISFMKDLLFYYRKDKRKYFKEASYIDDIGEYIQYYGNEKVEYVFAFYIDEKKRYRACDVISTGQEFSAQLDFVYIEKRAKQHGVRKVVIAHNHPSGLAIPSHADFVATEMAKYYIESMGIELIDHIIFERDDFVFLLAESNMSGRSELSEFFDDWTDKKYGGKLPEKNNYIFICDNDASRRCHVLILSFNFL